jgi:hypothetical protein
VNTDTINDTVTIFTPARCALSRYGPQGAPATALASEYCENRTARGFPRCRRYSRSIPGPEIFRLFSEPSAGNPYLFNADDVNRGSLVVEIFASLIAPKLAALDAICLVRGNHETETMNSLSRFESECKKKSSLRVFDKVTKMFNALPLGHVLGACVFVIHGSLFWDQTTMIESLQQETRDRQPPESGAMTDILWNDSTDQAGESRKHLDRMLLNGF